MSFLHVPQAHLLVATMLETFACCCIEIAKLVRTLALCLHFGSRDTTRGIYRPKGELLHVKFYQIYLFSRYGNTTTTTSLAGIYKFLFVMGIDDGENLSNYCSYCACAQ